MTTHKKKLTLAYSATTDPATKAWEKSRPKGDQNPKLSPTTRAILETVQVARGGNDALIEALQEALVLKYEREDRDELAADVAELKESNEILSNNCNELEANYRELEKERDALREKLDQVKRILE